jgi:CBS domain-containing protein
MIMNNASEFIQVFTKFENWIRKNAKIGNQATFEGCIAKLENSNRLIRSNSYFLRSMGRLRNAIVHADNYDETIIAVPNDDVVTKFRKIVESIMKSPMLLEYCSKNPPYVSKDISLPEVLRNMFEHDYSQVIVENCGEYRLLSREGVSKWVEANIDTDLVSITETKVADVLPHEDNTNCEYVGRSTDIFAFIDIIGSPKKRVQAVIITEHGRPDEKPLGIATVWDAGVILSKLNLT